MRANEVAADKSAIDKSFERTFRERIAIQGIT